MGKAQLMVCIRYVFFCTSSYAIEKAPSNGSSHIRQDIQLSNDNRCIVVAKDGNSNGKIMSCLYVHHKYPTLPI